MRLSVNVNLTSHTVGRWLAAAEETNENIIVNGCYQIEMQTKLKAPSDEGAYAVQPLRLSLIFSQSLRVAYGNPPPFTQGRLTHVLNFTYFYTVFFYLTTNTEYCIIITIIIMAKNWIIF